MNKRNIGELHLRGFLIGFGVLFLPSLLVLFRIPFKIASPVQSSVESRLQEMTIRTATELDALRTHLSALETRCSADERLESQFEAEIDRRLREVEQRKAPNPEKKPANKAMRKGASGCTLPPR